MNVREYLGIKEEYAAFNREERNLAAIFYHAVQLGDNLDRFLAAAGCEQRPTAGTRPPVYFDHAYLRDAWNGIRDEDTKRGLILRFLPLDNAEELRGASIHDFNAYFGAVPRASRRYIQSPGNWSVPRFDPNVRDNDVFLGICKFKWAFNIKPDIVIQTGPNACVCIEAKLESAEGCYPSSGRETTIFGRRGLAYVSQTSVQQTLMTDLLGFDTEFLLLASKHSHKAGSHRFISWADAFAAMETDGLPDYMKTTIRASS